MATYNETASGGALVGRGAQGIAVIHNPSNSGGADLGGGDTSWYVFREVIASGGGTLGGLAVWSDPVKHYPNLPLADPDNPGGDGVEHNPALYIDGEAELYVERQTESQGGVTVGSSAINEVTVTYESSGEVTIGGSSDVKSTIVLSYSYPWRIRAGVSVTRTFLWDTGLLQQYWYRIVSKQAVDPCVPTRVEDCCLRYIVNVHARTLTDLCEQIRARGFNFTIDTVQRFTRPAETSQIAIAEADGTVFTDECEEIDICANPVCNEFCIDGDVVMNIGWTNTTPQVNAFFEYEADTGDGLLTAGSAIAGYEETPFELFHESPDAELAISGSADVLSSAYNYTSSDGVVMGGTSDLSSSHYDFIGGNWPLLKRKDTALDIENLEAESVSGEEVIEWLNPRYAIIEDGFYAISDVSYEASSDYLYVRNFEFEIPSGVNIGLIRFNVVRSSIGGDIGDIEVYVVNGDEILSPNLANASLWPLVPTNTAYQVISDNFTSAIPGLPIQEGGWDIDDVNSEDFGFIIRVQGQTASSGVIAQIDHVNMRIFYEDEEHQLVRASGQAGVVSSAWSYQASGGVETGGETDRPRTVTYWNGIGGAEVSGDLEIHYDYEADSDESGITIGGEATTQPIMTFGGAVVGGSAIIAATTNFYEASGGMTVAEGETESLTWVTYNTESFDGLTVDGESVTLVNYSYEPEGGVEIGGTISTNSSSWRYETDGNAIFIGGTADLVASNLEPSEENFGFQMNITEIDFLFGTDSEVGGLTASTDTVSVCGCTDIPLTLEFSNNIVRNNKLAQFLKRNNYSMSDRFELYYNKVNDMWQRNVHIEGLSADINTRESWDMVFNLKCTTFVGGEQIDREVLLFSIHIKQKNLVTFEDFSTRVIVGYRPDLVCSATDFNVSIVYDTQLNIASVSPDSQIYYNRLYDDLGLFKNQFWGNNPNLRVEISSVELDEEQYRQNMDVVFNS